MEVGSRQFKEKDAEDKKDAEDAKKSMIGVAGMPLVQLGKTGAKVSILGFGARRFGASPCVVGGDWRRREF